MSSKKGLPQVDLNCLNIIKNLKNCKTLKKFKKVLAFLEKHGILIQVRLVGQAVKTPPSHGGIRGSIPLEATI